MSPPVFFNGFNYADAPCRGQGIAGGISRGCMPACTVSGPPTWNCHSEIPSRKLHEGVRRRISAAVKELARR
jgi:hypothetical protein